MARLISAMLIVVAIIHWLPLPGVLGAPQLARLYGIGLDDPNLILLLRHRAVLFGLLGALLMLAAFRPALQPLALIAGYASVLSFLLLAAWGAGHNSAVQRVIIADWVALGALLIATAARWWVRRDSA